MYYPLHFALNLLAMTLSSTTTSVQYISMYFKTLPCYLEHKIRGIYVLVLERDAERPRLYIGSETDSILGFQQRFNNYERRSRKRQSCRFLNYNRDP